MAAQSSVSCLLLTEAIQAGCRNPARRTVLGYLLLSAFERKIAQSEKLSVEQ
jgi:hypothetical protein